MALSKCRECGTEVSEKTKVCPKCGIKNPVKKTSLLVKIILGLFGIGLLANLVNGVSGGGSSQSSSNPTHAAVSVNPLEEAIKNVKLANLTWRKVGFESVLLLDVVIENKGKKDVKDVEIECVHFSNSGTQIDSNKKVIYELVKAGSFAIVRDFSMGFIHSQATSSKCRVNNLVLL